MSELTIKDKDAILRKLNKDDAFAWAQREMVQQVQYQHNNQQPIRIIVLKGRQLGLSTFSEALLFLWCFMFPGSNCLVMSQDKEKAETLFEMTKLFWETWPHKAWFTADRNAIRRLSWRETLSNFKVESAKTTDPGRGTTIQAVHCSEVAFWDDAEDLTPALMNAVPTRHGTIIILESTANGVGGYFYDQWMEAMHGESDFIPLFFPWFLHNEYTVRSTSLTEKQLTMKERDLRDDFNLTLGQLAWRRRKIRELAGDEEKFQQEFPCTWMEAFLSTGSNVFPLQALSECYFPQGSEFRGSKVGMSRGNLINDNGTLRFMKDYSGELKVYRLPDAKKKMEYVVGCDPSRTQYGDPACIQVLNRSTLEQVAVWHGHAIDAELAELIANLGFWYNTAMVNVEINGGGAGVIAMLVAMRYPSIWRWRRPDRPLHRLGHVFGWSTNQLTKPWGIGSLQHYLNKRALIIHDPTTYLEMMEYTVLDGVEMGPASSDGHDDTVMAMLIALMTTITSDPPDFSSIHGFDSGPYVPVGVGADGYDEPAYGEVE
jgi:hypothetical protein